MMEIMEVMSIHVALPVIGVLICAFLVFAFGFRSPVQPPSFDFSEDKKNQKKTKKAKSKGQTNGHIVQVKEDASKTLTPKSARQSISNKQKSPTNEKKNKKSEKSTRPVTAVNEKTRPKPEVEIGDDVGWSVAVSKKKDKIRSKREEKEKEEGENKLSLEDIGFDSKPEDVPAEVPTTQPDPPQEQRTTKKKRQSKKSEDETTTDSTEAEQPKVEDVVPTPPEPAPVQPDVKTEDKLPAASKKSKNKSDKTTEDKTDTKPAEDPTPASSNKNTKKSKSKKLSPDAEEFQPMVYDNKPKTQTSPKKPRNKNNSQTQESEEVSHVEEIKEVLKPVVKQLEEKTIEPVKDIITEETNKLEDKNESSSESKTVKEPVVFNELAATSPTWQDAPKTKKKKARREN